MQLTVRQAAEILKVPEKTVYNWIDAGDIPLHRVGEQVRFSRSEILEWATARGIPFATDLFRDQNPNGDDQPRLLEALVSGGIHRDVGGADRSEVLRAVVDRMPIERPGDRDTVYQLLLAREAMGSTAVGGGIAIPHVRNPVVLHVTEPSLTLCFLTTAVDYGAVDGRPVDTLFSLVSQNVRAHLHLLALLAGALRDPGFRAAVNERAPDAGILAEAKRVEAALAAPAAGGPK